ncbi:hypothetical protein V500_03991 [Pseudogymnoascus sp. VKM F-4518 (FW-2643)]|nr:hypothetical protein V500_03991 [Pseudogymnoascus sp. VKM F-4518 (FW-2643)]
MSTIVVSLTSLISSIVQTIGAALQSVTVVFQFLFHAILGTIQAVFAALCGAISGLARTFEGLTKFLLGNIVPIGGVVASFVVYTAYQQRKRTSPGVAPAMQKKTN